MYARCSLFILKETTYNHSWTRFLSFDRVFDYLPRHSREDFDHSVQWQYLFLKKIMTSSRTKELNSHFRECDVWISESVNWWFIWFLHRVVSFQRSISFLMNLSVILTILLFTNECHHAPLLFLCLTFKLKK